MPVTPLPALVAGRVTVHLGDCLDLLRTMPDGSVDAIVTDPPYGLGFMGKDWDTPGAFVERRPIRSNTWDHVGGNHNPSDAADAARTRRAEGVKFGQWCELWAVECLRVLKPGGHLVAFGGTRTWHRLACAVEDAGFEIRDAVAALTGQDAPALIWAYGSGFPKSHDIGKAIDKRRDDQAEIRVVCRWLRARIVEHPTETMRSLADRFGFHVRMVEHWAALDTDSQPTLPTLDQWEQLRAALGFGHELDDEVRRLNARKGKPGEAWAQREVIGKRTTGRGTGRGTVPVVTDVGNDDLTAPATDDARAWQGWGTALKPAWEPIILARKPLAGPVAVNVLQHGTGALNIDACRVEVTDAAYRANAAGDRGHADNRGRDMDFRLTAGHAHDLGRWPANLTLVHDAACVEGGPCAPGCPVVELDTQSGWSQSPTSTGRGAGGQHGAYSPIGAQGRVPAPGDAGGASRFFPQFRQPPFRYQAKAPSRERPRLPDGTAHPTVKPVALMRWLVRLVTPPGGRVLDPFAGSGTTGEACAVEGFECVLIEREAPYVELIRARLDRLPPSLLDELGA